MDDTQLLFSTLLTDTSVGLADELIISAVLRTLVTL